MEVCPCSTMRLPMRPDNEPSGSLHCVPLGVLSSGLVICAYADEASHPWDLGVSTEDP